MNAVATIQTDKPTAARLLAIHCADFDNVAPSRREAPKRHGYGWTVAVVIVALALMAMTLR